VELPLPGPDESLDQQIQTVADHVTQLILASRQIHAGARNGAQTSN
jgi:hypothetical protein